MNKEPLTPEEVEFRKKFIEELESRTELFLKRMDELRDEAIKQKDKSSEYQVLALMTVVSEQTRNDAQIVRRLNVADKIKEAALAEIMRHTPPEHRYLVQAELWRVGLTDDEWEDLCIEARESLTKPQIARIIGVARGSDEASAEEVNRIIRNGYIDSDKLEREGMMNFFPLVYAVTGDKLSEYQKRVRIARDKIIERRSGKPKKIRPQTLKAKQDADRIRKEREAREQEKSDAALEFEVNDDE